MYMKHDGTITWTKKATNEQPGNLVNNIWPQHLNEMISDIKEHEILAPLLGQVS